MSKSSFYQQFVTVHGPKRTDFLITLFVLLGVLLQAQFVLAAPQFIEMESPFLRLDVVGGNSIPSFADIDGDGDQDAFIGGIDGTINYYKNNNSSLEQESANPLDIVNVQRDSAPALVDIDNDGDQDAFIGKNEGTVSYYKNTGDFNNPFFVEQTGGDNPLNPVNVTVRSTLTFGDIDNDSDLDAIIGAGDGTLYYYENIGSTENPKFEKQTGPNNPFNNIINVGSNSVPTLGDIDKDGDLDLLIGEEDGIINYYENINTVFEERIGAYNPLNGIDVGEHSAPVLVDFDKDGNLDVFIGASDGTVKKFEKIVAVDPPIVTIEPITSFQGRSVDAIKGTVSSPVDGVKIERIDLQVSVYKDGKNFYLSDGSFIEIEESWLPVAIPEEGKVNWSYDISNVDFNLGRYIITVRAYDNAKGETSEKITVLDLFDTEIYLFTNRTTIKLDEKLEYAKGTLNKSSNSKGIIGETVALTISTSNKIIHDDTTTTNNKGEYEFDLQGFSFPKKGKYLLKASFAGNDIYQEKSISIKVLVDTPVGYAILVQGKSADSEGLDAHNKTLNNVYKVLKKRSFLKEHIRYFNYELDQDVDEDGTNDDIYTMPNKADMQDKDGIHKDGIQTTIETWAYNLIIGSPAPLYIIMVDHGSPEKFHLNKEHINSADDLATWLETFENKLKEKIPTLPSRIIILGSCYSGSFINDLSKEGRIIITSADENELSYKGPEEKKPNKVRSGEYFIDELFNQLDPEYQEYQEYQDVSLKRAFEKATKETESFTCCNKNEGSSNNINNPNFLDNATQHPLLDDNGDKKGSNVLYSQGDGQKAAEIKLGGKLSPNSISFIRNTGTGYLEYTDSSIILWLTTDIAIDEIEEVVVEIRDPVSIDKVPTNPTIGTEQIELNLTRRSLTFNSENNRYEYTYDGFDKSGKYQIFYYVYNTEKENVFPVKRSSVVYKKKQNNEPPMEFKLLYPIEGASTRTDLRFDWESATDPDGDSVTYTFLVATNKEDFNNSVVYKQEGLHIPLAFIDNFAIINDEREDATTGLKDLTTYFWKVEAIDYFGARTSSEIFSFNTNNFANGGPDPIDDNCDGTLDNNNNCATFENELHIPAIHAFELGWFEAYLQPFTERLRDQSEKMVFVVNANKLKLISQVQQPTGNEAIFFPDTGELLVRTVEIFSGGKKIPLPYYRVRMQPIPNTNPLQFQLEIDNALIPFLIEE